MCPLSTSSASQTQRATRPRPDGYDSHDHGVFFPGQNNWTPQTLAAAAAVQLDGVLSAIGFTAAELREAARELRATTEVEIAEAIGFVPTDWSVPPADLAALTDYVRLRRTALLAMIDGMP
jgi:hypothetical protein